MTVSAVGNFCITVTNETATPTGGITCSALGGAVNRHLLRLRLTSARSSRRLSTRGSTVASVQISQGNSRDLPAYACRIYVTAFRASIGLWRFVPPHPAVPPLSASCSSGQHFASGFLQIRGHPRHPCLRLTLPLAGCVEDFHLQVTHLATTTKRVALTRNAPCLAHTKKRPERRFLDTGSNYCTVGASPASCIRCISCAYRASKLTGDSISAGNEPRVTRLSRASRA
ncbi:hypothetical protein BIKONL_001519 [Pseudomonas putida]